MFVITKDKYLLKKLLLCQDADLSSNFEFPHLLVYNPF